MSARRDRLAGRDRHAVVREAAGAGKRGDRHGQQRVGRAVADVAEAEVRGREGVGRVLERGHGVVGAGRGVVDRGHVDGHRVGGRIEVDAAVGGAAVSWTWKVKLA